MDKADQISKVIDRLNDDEKDKLLKFAQQLLKAQQVVKGDSAKSATPKRKSTKKSGAEK